MIAICQTKSIAKLIIRISPLLLGLLLFPQVPLLFCVSVHIFGRNVLLYVRGKNPIAVFSFYYTLLYIWNGTCFFPSFRPSLYFYRYIMNDIPTEFFNISRKEIIKLLFFSQNKKKHFTDSKFFSSSKRIKSAPLYKQGISYSLQISYSPIDTFPAIMYRKKASQ